MMLTQETISEILKAKFGEEAVIAVDESSTPVCFQVQAQLIDKICQELYENESTYFDYLSCITGIDNGEAANSMEVIYNLYSIPFNFQLMIKVVIPREAVKGNAPEVASVMHIWHTANWHERETYDLLGIKFTNHPDLRRILLPNDWEGHPLRKDYQLQDYYHGIKVRY